MQYFAKQETQKTAHWWLCMQHSLTAAALSTSFLLNLASNSPYSWTHLLQDLGSHKAALVWVVSQKDWTNQAAGWIQAMH